MASKKTTTSNPNESGTVGHAAVVDTDAIYGDTRPTMVNGRYVGDKRFNVKTGAWEANPKAVPGEASAAPGDADETPAQDTRP